MEVRRGGDEKLLPQPCNKRYSAAKKDVHFRSETQMAQCGTCAVEWQRLNCVCSGLPNEA